MSEENIFLFVPNLIGGCAELLFLPQFCFRLFLGYARVILALISFYFMPTNYVLATVCYVTSALLDAFDGHAARYLNSFRFLQNCNAYFPRYFNQSTKFGAILDQLTDRCGTMCLCAVLAHFYPKYMFLFLLSMTVDVACHWIYLHTYVRLLSFVLQ